MKRNLLMALLITFILTGCGKDKVIDVVQESRESNEWSSPIEPDIIVRDNPLESSERVITIPALEVETEETMDESKSEGTFDLSSLNLGDLTVASNKLDTLETEDVGESEVSSETCNHNYERENTTLEFSCDKDYQELYKCTICGKAKTETIPAKGHDYSESTVDATCASLGYTLKKCTKCGYEVKENMTAAEAHKETVKVYQNPTCELQGINEISCTVCNTLLRYAVVDALGHNWEKSKEGKSCEAGAVDEYTCKNCKKKRTEDLAGEHKFGGWSVTNKATCSTEGKRNRVCSVCSYKEEQTIPKEEHNLGSWVVETDATCTKAGKQTRSCSVCNKVIDSKPIKKLEHVYDWIIKKEAACTEEGIRTQRCARCLKESTTEKIPPTDHSYFISNTVNPLCEETGYTNYKCSKCDSVYSEKIEPLGHTYNSEGACIRCGAVK